MDVKNFEFQNIQRGRYICTRMLQVQFLGVEAYLVDHWGNTLVLL